MPTTPPERGWVLLTGGTGFLGRHTLRRLLGGGWRISCLLRDPARLCPAAREAQQAGRLRVVAGDVGDREALREAARDCQGAVHLVGIISQRLLAGQTFGRVHVVGTSNAIEVCKAAGVKRFVYISSLGARPKDASLYHRSKFAAEELVRASGLAWTILRPSVILGSDGEFTRLVQRFVQKGVAPVFGRGDARLQPIAVQDVVECIARALAEDRAVGRIVELGGPQRYTWVEFYRAAAQVIRGDGIRVVRMPVVLARLMAVTVFRLPILPPAMRVDLGQVRMSQEDNICDPAAAEQAFGVALSDPLQALASPQEEPPAGSAL